MRNLDTKLTGISLGTIPSDSTESLNQLNDRVSESEAEKFEKVPEDNFSKHDNSWNYFNVCKYQKVDTSPHRIQDPIKPAKVGDQTPVWSKRSAGSVSS